LGSRTSSMIATIVDRFAVHDKPGAVDNLMGH
jgi:hypothetical protein